MAFNSSIRLLPEPPTPPTRRYRPTPTTSPLSEDAAKILAFVRNRLPKATTLGHVINSPLVCRDMHEALQELHVKKFAAVNGVFDDITPAVFETRFTDALPVFAELSSATLRTLLMLYRFNKKAVDGLWEIRRHGLGKSNVEMLQLAAQAPEIFFRAGELNHLRAQLKKGAA